MGKGYVPERNPYFKKYTTRTMRPVIDFDTCVKCNLCWISCPDSCFDVMPDATFDANMEACCGCGVCEAVCPVENCITMVNESLFDDNASQWEMWRQDKAAYKTWLIGKISDKKATVRSHGFRFRGQYEEELKQDLDSRRRGDHRGHPGRERAAQDGVEEEDARHGSATTRQRPRARDDKELLISGSEAVAEALTLADIDVVTAYPIRPYDTVMQAIAKKIANGQLVAEYIVAEGEHSQFEIVKHASTVGARVFCGSSGVGWAYAIECLVVTPPLRVPMVCLVGNRALDDPGAFGVEHNDALFVRDLGWMLLLGRHLAGGARHHADRLPRGRGPARVPAAGHLGRRRLPHPLAGHHPGAAEGEGRPVPAALRPRRSAAASRQPDHGGPAGQRGLGHRDPPPERRGHEARRTPSSRRPTPTSARSSAAAPRTRGSRST